MSFDINMPKNGLLGHLDEYIDLYEQTDSLLVLKHITVFVTDELNKTGKPFTEEDICDKIDGYILDRVLTKLVEEGLVEVSFEEDGPLYKATPRGEVIAKELGE